MPARRATCEPMIGRAVAAGQRGLHHVERVAGPHRGGERGEGPVGQGIALAARSGGSRAGGRDGGGASTGSSARNGSSADPGVDRRRDDPVGPGEQARRAPARGRRSPRSRNRPAAGSAAACRTGRRAGPPRRLRRARAAASWTACGRPTPLTSASTSRPTGDRHLRQPAEALLLGRRRAGRRSARTASDEGRGRATTSLTPTSAICTASCSMSNGSPPLARSSRRRSASCCVEVDGCPPAASTRCRKSSTAGPDSGSWSRGTTNGRDAHDPLRGLAGHRHRGDGQACVGGRGHHLLERRPQLDRVQVEAVDDQPGCRCCPSPGTRHPRRSHPGWAAVERIETRTEDVLGLEHAARVDPGAPADCRRVACEQRLSATGRTHDADPARRRQRRGEAGLSLLATETWGEHGTNLSGPGGDWPAGLGRTTDVGAPRFART